VQSRFSFLVVQLLGQAPMLLVYLAAIVLALAVLRRRSPVASLLVLAGAGLSIVLAVAWAFVFQWAITTGNNRQVQQWAFANQFLHAIAIGLIVAAAFVDRGPQRASAFEVRTPSDAPPPPLPVRPLGE
jgi:hypothetical protein